MSGSWEGDPTGPPTGSHISVAEQAKTAVLAWRLQPSYLIYCFVLSTLTGILVFWNFFKFARNHHLPEWQHHVFEELLEVIIGGCMIVETMMTIPMLGVREFFASAWCIFDLLLAVLTAISIGYGMHHLGRRGEVVEANVPLLMLRFVLQPVRAVVICWGASRAREMQRGADELQIDFGNLPMADAMPGIELPERSGGRD